MISAPKKSDHDRRVHQQRESQCRLACDSDGKEDIHPFAFRRAAGWLIA
jgi:hypothetical protein